MKFLFDLFPLILFFATYKWGTGHVESAQALGNQFLSSMVAGGAVPADLAALTLATAVAILGTVGQIVYVKLRGRKVDGMLWLALIVVGVFGGAGIYFHDKTFIKWKPTILYWCFALALYIGQVVFKKNGVRTAMEAEFKLPDFVWTRLLYAWVLFHAAMGFLNLFVAFVLFKENDNAWVNFKFYGLTGMMLVFIVGQTIFLAKYLEENHES
ncbi:MAG: septation protein A [Pseudomonadota bacterium]